MQRIFEHFVAGAGYARLARELTEDGIPSPSAHDPERNRHRAGSGGVWAKSAIKAILQNPRYTGHETWAKQRRDEVLLDEHNVALGHTSKLRWNDQADWIHSHEPTHTALVTTELFEQAQDIIASASRPTTGNRRTPNPYLLKGMVRCSICNRKMQGNQLRGDLHYRCVIKNDYPAADHPRSLSVREEHLLPIVDNWLGELFSADNIEDTTMTLERSQQTPQATADELEARRIIKECDAELANYRAALKASPSESRRRLDQRNRGPPQSRRTAAPQAHHRRRHDRRRDPRPRRTHARHRRHPQLRQHRGPTACLRGRPAVDHLRPPGKTSETPRISESGGVEFRTCRRGDLNPHVLADTSPSSWRVCQFRHSDVARRPEPTARGESSGGPSRADNARPCDLDPRVMMLDHEHRAIRSKPARRECRRCSTPSPPCSPSQVAWC